MKRWFDFQRLAKRSRLRALLATYVPYQIPYPGPGRILTAAQADANLAYLLANRAERLQIAAELLAHFGLDVGTALKGADPKPFVDALWRWSVDEWPTVADARLQRSAWIVSKRDGDEIVFSMLTDVAIILAEMVLVRRTDYYWTLDRDPENKADDMISWQRPVVIRPEESDVPKIMYDFEYAACISYEQCTRPAYGVINNLGHGTLEAISGTALAAWRSSGWSS